MFLSISHSSVIHALRFLVSFNAKKAMTQLCDLQIHVNGQQTFFLNEKIISKYAGRLKKMIKKEKRKTQIRNLGIDLDDFPGGPDGFELVSRFCYNNGRIKITVSNVPLLHSCAVFLGMSGKISSSSNLLEQTETFLEGIFYWSWKDILVCLKSSETFFAHIDFSGLAQKLICALLGKIGQNSDMNIITSSSSSSSSSSPETANSGFRLSKSSPSKTTPDSISPWWFHDLTILPPKIIEKIIKTLGAYGTDNNSLILTRFLLHYLKSAAQRKCYGTKGGLSSCWECAAGLADTAAHGVLILVGKKYAFSCRKLFWVLRIVSRFDVSKEYRFGLERLIGGMLDQATLDDLLVSGHDHRGVYDVNLVLRLIRVFVNYNNGDNDKLVQKMKKVGRLIEKYLGEISPDQNLKMSKFLGVAESLPDSARDCFDGVYRAIDIYLECHPSLPFEERSRLCRCLNYEKLSMEACKDLAKNQRIPPRVAVKALLSRRYDAPAREFVNENSIDGDSNIFSDQENEDMKLNLWRMQWRVVELEKLCKDMKTQMKRFNGPLPRLC